PARAICLKASARNGHRTGPAPLSPAGSPGTNGRISRPCRAARHHPRDQRRIAMMEPSLNVMGEVLEPCSTAPLTGFFRNGCCDTGPADRGSHTVCAVMTAEFLALSKYLGNDL